jgi:phenylalanyl-tRNA synthetase beta chain
MKVTYHWLKEYTDFDLTPDELASALTMAGLEVEGVEDRRRRLDKIVIGRVLEVRRHQAAEQLSVCDVDIGERRLRIVCGAPNVAEGQLVPVALEGAVLPGDVTISRREIRGVVSEGMICSEAELGISSRADTIMVLDGGLQPGLPASEVFGEGDVVIELNVTPNRPDCLGVIGVAREVAVLVRSSLHKPEIKLQELGPPIEELASVEIVDADLCPRYTARVIQGVRLGPSPWWLVQRLEAVGIRSINNIVDVTNYVMLETGQPLHAFDYDRLAGGKIVVRRARKGQRFVTLDEKEHVLDDDTLMICDAQQPVAIGGVMGGFDSEVGESTRNVLLESAYFDPTGIRRTAKKLGINTEASRRFERGTDPNGIDYALHRATQLIQEIAGGKVARGFADAYPKPIQPKQVPLRLSRVNLLLGSFVPRDEVVDILTRLEFTLEGEETLQVTVPTFRPDITREVDLIEEVARIYGYEKIPEKTKDQLELLQPLNLRERGTQVVRDTLVGLGFHEVLTYSMVHQNVAALFQPEQAKVHLANPLSEELSTLRPSLVPGLLSVVQWNVNRKRPNLRLFEIGDVFWREGEGEPIVERTHLAGAITGKAVSHNWSAPDREYDFYDLKGMLEAFFGHLSVAEFRLAPGQSHATDRQTLRITVDGEDLGYLGRIRSDLLQPWDLEQPVFAFEIDLQKLLEHLHFERTYQPIPRFPAVERDLSVVVDEKIQAGDLLEALRRSGGELLRSVELFDVYTGEPIPSGKKSLSFSLRFASNERTLTEEEVDQLISEILRDLAEAFGATLR